MSEWIDAKKSLPDLGVIVICRVYYPQFHNVDYGAGQVIIAKNKPVLICERTGNYSLTHWTKVPKFKHSPENNTN